MKAKALTVHWHLENQPIYSAHFQPSTNGANRRLATAGGDNNVRIWRLEYQDQANPTAVTSLTYLATLAKHTQAVNVVRFDPKGVTLASAGDDGVIFLWSLSDSAIPKALGEDTEDDKETWKLRNMCRSSISEIYDLAWSPDSQYLIAGSMDNVARVYNASTGQCIRELAEHSHYVQGVAWDPFNEYIATQSSDRSVHIYNLKTKDGQFSLGTHHKIARVDLPARKLPAKQGGEPPASPKADNSRVSASPDYSAPETPSSSSSSTMNPPPSTVKPSYSRKSSFGSAAESPRASSAPFIPLPAVRQIGSPNVGYRSTYLYHNETFTPVLAPTSALTTEPLVPLISSMPPIATHGTPPQTPQQSVAQLSTRAPKRANEEGSTKSNRSSTAASSSSSKKRRIAPTLVEKKD
ncbi:hypothetical protein DV454_004475 [Geotrichum candidum]|nr:hypothetical protein DV454_004475 [Geotrichum candidum]